MIGKAYKLLRGMDYEYGVEPIVFTPKEFKGKEGYYLKDGKVLYEKTR